MQTFEEYAKANFPGVELTDENVKTIQDTYGYAFWNLGQAISEVKHQLKTLWMQDK